MTSTPTPHTAPLDPPTGLDGRDLAAILATIPDPGVRRQAAAKAALDRRAQLATYGLVYAEVYGRVLPLEQLLDDALLIRLLTLADA